MITRPFRDCFKVQARIVVLLVFFTMSVWPASASSEDGALANEKADYARVCQELEALAKQGNASAQFNLGLMYNLGRGVRQDLAKAVKWWRKAAEQCNTEAQYLLNMMYGPGKGLPRANGFKPNCIHADADRESGAAERKVTKNEYLTEDKVTKGFPVLLFIFCQTNKSGPR